MINSKGSSVVVGEQRADGPRADLLVVPDRGREGEEALKNPGHDPEGGAAAVALQVELALKGLVHRLDDLAKRLEEPSTGPGSLALHRRAEKAGAVLVQEDLELGASVALVGEDDLALSLSKQPGVGLEQVSEHLALVGLGVSEREGDRQPRRGADKVQAQSPEVAGVLAQ